MFFKGNFTTRHRGTLYRSTKEMLELNVRPRAHSYMLHYTIYLFTCLCLLEDVMKQRVASFPHDLTNVVIVRCPADEVAPHCRDIQFPWEISYVQAFLYQSCHQYACFQCVICTYCRQIISSKRERRNVCACVCDGE